MAEGSRDSSSRSFMGFGGRGAAMDIAPPTGPAELGKLLCATRMRLGKDLQRVADVLHIRYNYLVAIEDGRYEDLPGQAYAIGFVRAYADHLDLDGDEIVRRYKEESAGVKHKSSFELQMPTSDSALPSGTLLLIAVVAGMVIYGVWFSLAGSDRSAVELIQEVPDRLAAIADPDTIQAALPVTADPGIANTDGTGVIDPAAAPATKGGGAMAPSDETLSAAVPTAALAPPPVLSPPGADPAVTDVIELRAKADVWITLRDEKTAERTQFLRKSEILRLPEQGVTTLVTANAGDLEILVNGKTMPPLDAGLFARGVALDPQKLKSASAAVPAVPATVGVKPSAPAAPAATPAPASTAPDAAAQKPVAAPAAPNPAPQATAPSLEAAKPSSGNSTPVPPAAPAPTTPPSR